jgi:predicted lactoylglutathione lyase
VPKHIFVSLPVRDLKQAIAFYTAIGANLNPQFSDETASCMVLTDNFFVMLLTHARWATFTKRPIVDAHRENEVQLGFSAEDKSTVDKITAAAAASGGQADINPKQDLGFMYSRSFADVDGHVWECMYMDMSQLPKG